MTDSDLLFLKTLYEERNITRTSKKLFIAQPSLSEKVKKLEKDFGAPLIIRHSRGIDFTSEGEILALYAIRALKDFNKTKIAIANMKDEMSGILKIACSHIFGKYHLPQLLAGYHLGIPKSRSYCSVTIAELCIKNYFMLMYM